MSEQLYGKDKLISEQMQEIHRLNSVNEDLVAERRVILRQLDAALFDITEVREQMRRMKREMNGAELKPMFKKQAGLPDAKTGDASFHPNGHITVVKP